MLFWELPAHVSFFFHLTLILNDARLKRKINRDFPGSPVVQTATAGGTGSIPGPGTKIPYAKKKEREKSAATVQSSLLTLLRIVECLRWKGSCVYVLSCIVVSDSATPWTIACQAPLSVGFSRQEYWRGLPFSSPGDLPQPGIEPVFSALAGEFFTTEPPGKLRRDLRDIVIFSPPTAVAPVMRGSSQAHSELVESSGPWFPSTPVPFRITWPHLKVFLSCYHAFPRLYTLFSPATRT